MRSNRIGNIIFAAAVCITFGLVKGDPGKQPHNEQDSVLRCSKSTVIVPYPGEHPLHFRLRVEAMWWSTPRFSEPTNPEEPGDTGPADGPADPCVNGDC